MLRRRGLIGGVAAFLAMPSIVRTPGLLMPIKPVLQWPTPLADNPYLEAMGDILFQNSDFPNAEMLSDRLRVAMRDPGLYKIAVS